MRGRLIGVVTMSFFLASLVSAGAVAGTKDGHDQGTVAQPHGEKKRSHGARKQTKGHAKGPVMLRDGVIGPGRHAVTGSGAIRKEVGRAGAPATTMKDRLGQLQKEGMDAVRQGFRRSGFQKSPDRRGAYRGPGMGRERVPIPGIGTSPRKGVIFAGGDDRARGRGAGKAGPGALPGRDWAASGGKGWRYGRARLPSYDARRREFVFPDGRRVRGTDPKGRPGRVAQDGSIVYRDGTVVRHDVDTGVTTVKRPDGTRFQQTYTRGPRDERPKYDPATDSYVYSDGKRVRARDSAGRLGTVRDDGSIEYEDGTVVTHDTKTGETVINRPDGTTVVDSRGTRRSSPPRYDSERDVYVYEDGSRPGTTIRARDPSGSLGQVREDGSIVYTDGTVVRRDSTRGITEVVKPDGSRKIYYSDGTVVSYDASTGSRTVRRPGASKDIVLEGGRKDGSDGAADAENGDGSDGGSDESSDGSDGGSDGGGPDEESDGGDVDDDGAVGAADDDASSGSGDDEPEKDASGRPDERRSGRGGPKATAPVDERVRRKRGEAPPEADSSCEGSPGGGFAGPVSRPKGPESETPCVDELVDRSGADSGGDSESPDPSDYAWEEDVVRRAPAVGPGPDCDERFMDCSGRGPQEFTRDPFDLSPVINPEP